MISGHDQHLPACDIGGIESLRCPKFSLEVEGISQLELDDAANIGGESIRLFPSGSDLPVNALSSLEVFRLNESISEKLLEDQGCLAILLISLLQEIDDMSATVLKLFCIDPVR